MPDKRRSRLSPERELELLDTALALVREHGYDQVTIDDIARATRASTATLYRRWGGKARMVITALRAGKPEPPSTVDTGSLRGDLLALADQAPVPGRVDGTFTSLTRDVLLDPDLMRALRELMIDPRLDVLRGVLRRHVDAGAIAADNAVLDLVDRVLIGPVLLDQLYLDHDPNLARRIVDDVLLPLLTARERG